MLVYRDVYGGINKIASEQKRLGSVGVAADDDDYDDDALPPFFPPPPPRRRRCDESGLLERREEPSKMPDAFVVAAAVYLLRIGLFV